MAPFASVNGALKIYLNCWSNLQEHLNSSTRKKKKKASTSILALQEKSNIKTKKGISSKCIAKTYISCGQTVPVNF